MRKNMGLFYLLMLSFVFPGVVTAANPTAYTSLNSPYGRISADQIDAHGLAYIANLYVPGYISNFRVFIPPGTMSVDAEILEWGGQKTIARHKTPPTTGFGNYSTITTGPRTLQQYETSDQIVKEDDGGRIKILIDSFTSPYLDISRAGWFYVNVDGQIGSTSYYNSVYIRVNAAAYNNWYDHSGSNADGSINWDKDVESVTEYVPASAGAGTPTISPGTGTTWTTSTSENITIASNNADAIYGNITSTEDGTTPADPAIPTKTSYNFTGTGASLTHSLAGSVGKVVNYKVRCIGSNSGGDSSDSGVYSYSIDLTSNPPGDVQLTPATGTVFKTSPASITASSQHSTAIYYTQTTDGTDPVDPFEINSTTTSQVVGPSNTIALPGAAGAKTTYKMKFAGYNANGGGVGNTSSVYTYVIDLTPPGAVVATPSTGTWTTSPQTVSVSCSGADKIYYTVSTSTNGSPSDPGEPTTSSNVITLTNGVGTFSVPSVSNADAITKVRFKGWNGGGFGTSLLCTYEINTYQAPVTVDPPGAATASPSEGNWTSASGAVTTVTSSNATSILATYTKTTDGSTPADPPDPDSSTAMLSSSGSSVTFSIPSTTQKLTKVKMKFRGLNSGGYGTVSSVCSYSVDLTNVTTLTPGTIAVSPESTNWTNGPQTIAVSSSNATQIVYGYNITYDGTDPTEPSDPSVSTVGNPLLGTTSSNQYSGTISGASGTFTVPYTTGKNTKIKIKFCGKNDSGYGTASQSYTYGIDATSTSTYSYGTILSQSDLTSNIGKDITGVITKTDGKLDPAINFLLIGSTKYSVVSLLEHYLQTALADSSITVTSDANGVITVSSPNFGSCIFSVMIGDLTATTENAAGAAQEVSTGDLKINIDGVAMTFYPACADQQTFDQTIQSYGWTVSYGANNVITVKVTSALSLSMRFQNFAFNSSDATDNTASTTQCKFTADADGTIKVRFPNGTIQHLIPYVHDPESFKTTMTNNGFIFMINSNTGIVQIVSNGSVSWQGLPDYALYSSSQAITVPSISLQDGNGDGISDLLFCTSQANQYIYAITK